jgi:hypothetical protein
MALKLVERRRKGSKFGSKDIVTAGTTKFNIFGLRSGATHCNVLIDEEKGLLVIRYKDESPEAFKLDHLDKRRAAFGGPGLMEDLKKFLDNGRYFELDHDTGNEYWYKQVRISQSEPKHLAA